MPALNETVDCIRSLLRQSQVGPVELTLRQAIDRAIQEIEAQAERYARDVEYWREVRHEMLADNASQRRQGLLDAVVMIRKQLAQVVDE